ncbi:MAG: glucose-1-phosphate adenylyltransferase, partial [Oscillospiraceae bacterium]|nr:glucose-1-phosphate adenylyltransferase [Oscillospiraceae bacterium]
MKQCVAMILAGGQGSRLYALTARVAKPAVPYGGKYRIIDFPLSNCINSGIDTVGVLTQYQPLELNDYIGDGRPWDLDRMGGGVHVLPPYQKATGSDWYLGTANAIYQNVNFIERYEPEYVLVLSGDHIYKMDYSKLIEHHRAHDAACTISVLEVPMDEASRFGIMNVREDGSVYEFEEKPKHPKSNLASMGIYVFTWSKLREYLEKDALQAGSTHDFGKDVIPAMLAGGERMFTYSFDGYWKDVGTIDSLWDSNMDLISPNVPFDLWENDFKIYSRNPCKPPHYIADSAEIQNSIVTEGCLIEGKVDFSVLFEGVTVAKNAVVRDSIVMPGSVIEEGAVVQYAIVAEDA